MFKTKTRRRASYTSTMIEVNEKTPGEGGGALIRFSQTTTNIDPNNMMVIEKEKHNADNFIQANVSNKLTMITDQLKFLQVQAKTIMDEANKNYDLHHVSCNFIKKSGQIYYLYERSNGQKQFSILTPTEWGHSCPHQYIGAYRLERDQSWTPENKLQQKTADQHIIKNILRRSNGLSITMGNSMDNNFTCYT